ncbi:MAG TPA: antibiotic biosynthesis monooxygenase [Nakamurella sp.]
MFVLIAHFDAGGEPPGSGEAVRLLGDQPDTRRLRWARSTEDPGRWVLTAEFDTAAAFRRAQSPLPVRSALIPWLAAAATSAAFEVIAAVDDGEWSEPEVIVDDPSR